MIFYMSFRPASIRVPCSQWHFNSIGSSLLYIYILSSPYMFYFWVSAEIQELKAFKYWMKIAVNPESTQNPITSENTLQEWRGSQDILRWRKTNRFCHQQTYSKRMANRKETIKNKLKKRSPGTPGKNTASKNIGKYSRLTFSSWDF